MEWMESKGRGGRNDEEDEIVCNHCPRVFFSLWEKLPETGPHLTPRSMLTPYQVDPRTNEGSTHEIGTSQDRMTTLSVEISIFLDLSMSAKAISCPNWQLVTAKPGNYRYLTIKKDTWHSLLAPTGALIVTVVYYSIAKGPRGARATFWNFEHFCQYI